jgi:hypothetical protein
MSDKGYWLETWGVYCESDLKTRLANLDADMKRLLKAETDLDLLRASMRAKWLPIVGEVDPNSMKRTLDEARRRLADLEG